MVKTIPVPFYIDHVKLQDETKNDRLNTAHLEPIISFIKTHKFLYHIQ